MLKRTATLLTVIAVMLLICANPSFAAGKKGGGGGGKGGGGGRGGGGGGGGAGQQQQPAQPVNPAIATDQSAVNSAQSDFETAQNALGVLVNKLELAFEQTPDYLAAKAKLATDMKALDEARQPVLAALQSDPDYAAALNAKKKAADDLAASRDNEAGPPDAETLNQLAGAMLAAGTTVSKLEATACEGDAGVVAAQEVVTADNAAIIALKRQFQASLPNNTDYAAAKATMDAAKAKIADAIAKLDADKGIAVPAPAASSTPPADATPAPAPAATPAADSTPAAAPAAATDTTAAATGAAN
jgi:hypothetical protein